MKNPNCRYPDMRLTGMCTNPCPLCDGKPPRVEQQHSWWRWLVNLVVRER